MGKTFTCEVEVRWGDSDRLGHVNNTKYFEYAQEARVRFYAECGYEGGRAARAAVLRTTDMEFLAPVTDESGPLSIEIVVLHIGTTSYTMRHTVHDSDGTVCAVGTATLVAYDPRAKTSRPLDDDERAMLGDYLTEA